MPALAEIRKKPQREKKSPKKRAELPDQKKPEPRGKLPSVELMRELARLVLGEGMSYARAYLKVFPHRRPQLANASTQAHLLVERYMQDHGRELQEMLIAHDLGEDRWADELNQRYKAKMLREIVKSEVKKVKYKDGRSSYKVLAVRNTVEVEDNTTRMRATELHADVLGARKVAGNGGIQQNVAVIYVVGGKIKKKRQERIVSP